MSYSALKTRVDVAEKALAAQLDHTQSSWYRLKTVAGEAFTPLRIIGTGMLSGLAIGFFAPWARLGGTMRIVELGTSVANLVGALQAQAAAEEASDAADSAVEVAADTAEVAQVAQEATAETQSAAGEIETVKAAAHEAVAEIETVKEAAHEAAAQVEATAGAGAAQARARTTPSP
jgi:methyl-accepting chemotaxis protein